MLPLLLLSVLPVVRGVPTGVSPQSKSLLVVLVLGWLRTGWLHTPYHTCVACFLLSHPKLNIRVTWRCSGLFCQKSNIWLVIVLVRKREVQCESESSQQHGWLYADVASPGGRVLRMRWASMICGVGVVLCTWCVWRDVYEFCVSVWAKSACGEEI